MDSVLSDSFVTDSQPNNVDSSINSNRPKQSSPSFGGTYYQQDSGNATGSFIDTTPIEVKYLHHNTNNRVYECEETKMSINCDESQASISPCDSPLEDDFANIDFNNFLTKLKDIDTPVEYDSSIEDSIEMIDEFISHIHVPGIVSTTEDCSKTCVETCMNHSVGGRAISPSIAIPTSTCTPASTLFPCSSRSPTLHTDFSHQSSSEEKIISTKQSFNPTRYPMDSPNIGE